MIALLALMLMAQDTVQLADDAFRAGDLDRAATLAAKAVRERPDPQAYMILGIVAASRQQWEAAARNLETVVRLAPADPNAYFYLGQAHLYQKKWEAALAQFRQAAARGFPDTERLLVEAAFAENEAGRPARALETLKRIPSPSSAHYHAVVAFASARVNRFKEALEEINTARSQEPGNAQYSEFLISTLIATDQMQAALREAIVAQAKFPDSGDIQYLFALASFYVSESPLSPLALRNLREVEPGSPRTQLAEGLLHRKLGENTEALAAFQKAAGRGLPDSHLLLAILYKENGDAAAAEREFREAERVNPNNGQLLLELGKLALARGDLAGAATRLERAVAYMPDNSAAHYQLGLAYGRLGRKADADRHAGIARELDRQHAELQKPAR